MIPSGKAHNEMLMPDDWDVDLDRVVDARGRELV